MAQVYSQNIVGYVNKTFNTGGAYYMIGAPFLVGANTVQDIMPGAPGASLVLFWNVGLQDIDPTTQPQTDGTTWSPNPVVWPGTGFFFVPGDVCTVTFVGNVPTGVLSRQDDPTGVGTATIVGSSAYVALSPLTARGGSVATVMAGYPATSGDLLPLFDPTIQDINQAVEPQFDGANWGPDYTFAIGEGFFVSRGDPSSATWSQTFNP